MSGSLNSPECFLDAFLLIEMAKGAVPIFGMKLFITSASKFLPCSSSGISVVNIFMPPDGGGGKEGKRFQAGGSTDMREAQLCSRLEVEQRLESQRQHIPDTRASIPALLEAVGGGQQTMAATLTKFRVSSM